MIELGLNISEKEYRQLNYPSYSLLSGISKNGSSAMYGIREDIADKDGIIIGSLVDTILTDGGLPPNLIIVDKKPTGKPLGIIKILANRTDLLDPEILSAKNNKLIEEELNGFKYYESSTFRFRLNKLKQYKKYAKALEDPTAFVASSYQVFEAKQLVNSINLKYSHLFDENTLMQTKLIGECRGIKMKCMLDFIVIDHVNKIIKPYDLKTGIGPHYNFFEGGFLGWNYYLQASLYQSILKQEAAKLYPDYTVDVFRFLYCGRKDKLPIIYTVSPKWHDAGYNGFTYNGVKYPGIHELVDDYLYYEQHPNALYRRGYTDDEVLFPDNFL